MPDATLTELVKEVRWKTLKLLEGVDDKQALFAPAGLKNSILWHAGHAAVVVEHLGFTEIIAQAPTYPAGWFEKFSWSSDPSKVTSWPALAEVVAFLTEQRTRLFAHIDSLSAEQLDKVIGQPPRSRTARGVILHGLHDEAGHQGEIHLLKKLYALGK
jgi:hypothetical protein